MQARLCKLQAANNKKTKMNRSKCEPTTISAIGIYERSLPLTVEEWSFLSPLPKKGVTLWEDAREGKCLCKTSLSGYNPVNCQANNAIQQINHIPVTSFSLTQPFGLTEQCLCLVKPQSHSQTTRDTDTLLCFLWGLHSPHQRLWILVLGPSVTLNLKQ